MTSRTQYVETGVESGPLCTSVAHLCAELRPRMSARTATGIDQVLQRMSAPLQVAVVGRIKSGKSTLVNALIGRRVAPTDVGECTKLVTRFQYGTVDRVEAVFRDGGKQSVPCAADGGIPAELGVDLDRVSHVEVFLTNAVLRELTVIDTPGLGSLNDTSLARTEELLGAQRESAEPGTHDADDLDPISRGAVAGAEAVLYVVTQTVRADDEQALATFAAATASRDAGPVNALAVLNQVDTVEADSMTGADGDVWQAASMLARNQARALQPRVADVLPVMGLLAETAETGEFTTPDAEALRELAKLDHATRDTMLMSADLFTGWDCELPADKRGRLLERLDLYGVRRALESIDADKDITAGGLRRQLGAASGFVQLRDQLDTVFRCRADGIKAAAALASLSGLVRDAGDPAEWRLAHDAIEALLAQPAAHQLHVLEVLTLVASGSVELPADLTAEVLRIGGTGSEAERLGLPDADRRQLIDSALERANWWRAFATFGSSPAQARVAHVVHRAYFLMWRRLSAND